jgi:hypothetical protein
MRRSCAICSPAIRLLGAEQRPSTECVAQMRRGAQPLTQGYYYHPSRHSAGQPIVAGWAYQFIAQLNFVRESWTAPSTWNASGPPRTPTRWPPSR